MATRCVTVNFNVFPFLLAIRGNNRSRKEGVAIESDKKKSLGMKITDCSNIEADVNNTGRMGLVITGCSGA